MKMCKYLSVLLIFLVLASACQQVVSEPIPEPLQIVSSSISGKIQIDEGVVLTFNRALEDTPSVAMEPHVDIAVSILDGGQSILVSPESVWEYNTDYRLEMKGLEYAFVTRTLPRVTVFVGGDVLLDKRPGERIAQYGPDSVFVGLQGLLDAADLRFANLENPASNRGQAVRKNFTFRSPPESLDALVSAGFDVVSFTNNHSLDFGEDAFVDTLDHLQARDIKYVGAGRNRNEALQPVLLEHDGITVAFIAFTQKTILPVWSPELWEAGEDKPGVVFLDGQEGRQQILNSVAKARSLADIVLVSLHWGFEGTRAPQGWQRSLAYAIVDAGADAILGHHPHLPFGIENYNGKPIVYSMGNLLFHPYDPEARESFVVVLDFAPDGLREMSVHPILMEDGTVRTMAVGESEAVLELIRKRSADLNTALEYNEGTLLFGGGGP